MKKILSLFLALVISAGSINSAQLWPVILDDVTYSNVEQYVVNDFRENDENQFMYIWVDTYARSICTGENFFGTGEDYLSLYTTGYGWSGLGFCLTDDGNGWQAAETLRAAIVNNPDNYYLHIAIKSTDNYSHCFYPFGAESTKFVLGTTSVYDGTIYDNFERDGEWHDFYIPMSGFASTLANTTCTPGVNVFCAMTEGVQGAQLNLDAVYFCDKEMIAIIPSPNKVQIGDYYYNIQDNKNTANLVSCVPNLIGDISIPAKVQYEGKEYDVTGISGYTFANCYNVTTITLPNSITRISSVAFNGCSSLRAIYVPCGELERFQQMSYDSRIQYVPLRYKIEAEHGHVTWNEPVAYSICDEHPRATFEVISDYGYHFTQWSDGNTDNPRTVELAQDTTFTVEFAVDRIGTCGDDNALSWTFDPTTKALTIRGDGALNGNYTFGVEAPNTLQKLVVCEGVTSIGSGAFAEQVTIQEISLPTTVKTVGEQAFYNCTGLRDIYNFRERPCVAYSNSFDGIDKFDCTLHVLSASIDMYKAATAWRDFYYIQTIDAEAVIESVDDVTISPTPTTAGVVWPAVSGAVTYELVIKDKQGNVICTLIFNANGQLTSIAFSAPARDNATEQTQEAGFSFTVTGLESGTTYDLTITAKDSNDQILQTTSQTFTTAELTGVEDIVTNIAPTKLILGGQLLILRGDKTYTIQGQEVK